MSVPLLQIGPGPDEGAHRLTVTLAAPSERWSEAARTLARDLADARCEAAWDPAARLDLVGAAGAGAGARLYLAGTSATWAGLTAARAPVPALAHLPLVLGQEVTALRLERRALRPPTYPQIAGQAPWPFRSEGPAVARRLRVEAQGLGRGELEGLRDLLAPALRRERWSLGVVPEVAPPAVEGEELVLPEPGLPARVLREVVHVWAQVFWVEEPWIRWTS